MGQPTFFGYAGRTVRVDLTGRTTVEERPTLEGLRTWVGGTGLGVKVLWEEVPAHVRWDQPANRLIFATGPLTGTGFSGAGGFSLVGIGPMTGTAGCTQANGYFGAYLKRSGLDALIIKGLSERWVYLIASEKGIEIRSAAHLRGLDTFETEKAIGRELGLKPSGLSVFSIGPAGENLVRFACVVGDRGHVASKNGLGAVMGVKKLKAVVALNGSRRPPVFDTAGFKKIRKSAAQASLKALNGMYHHWGTGFLVSGAHQSGVLPVKNYQTNLFPGFEDLDSRTTRKSCEIKRETCFGCLVAHCATVTVDRGPFKGLKASEPEYEIIAAFGPQILNRDYGGVVHLGDLADRLGLDANELGWLLGFVMEAFERGILSQKDLGGVEMTWGNVRACHELMHKIALRRDLGNLLAEGVKRAAEELGPEARGMAVHTGDGSTPRGHDHRGRWSELLDTCLSGTGTIEATFAGPALEVIGLDPLRNPFDHLEVAEANARGNGWRQFEDSLVTCRFAARDPELMLGALSCLTGGETDLAYALDVGRRISVALRILKLERGSGPEREAPSPRYGSTPTDGPCQGRSVIAEWEPMRARFFERMGWKPGNGRPTKAELDRLGLDPDHRIR